MKNFFLFLNRFSPLQYLVVVVLIMISGLSYFILQQEYENHISSAKNNTRFVSSLVAQQTQSSVKELDRILHSILLLTKGSEERPPLHTIRSKADYLQGIKGYHDEIMDLLLVNSQGNIEAWTGEGTPPDISDRAYVAYHLRNADSELYTGEPLLSKVHIGKWFFAVSKAVRNSAGEVDQIAVAIVDIEKFSQHLSSIERPAHSSLALISKQGTIISRVPGHDGFVGKKIELPYESLKTSMSGNFTTVSPFDNVERIAGFTHLSSYNITAFSTLSCEDILADWYFLRKFVVILLGVILGFIIWMNIKIMKAKSESDKQKELLSKQAQTDELTGLYNRRYVLSYLQEEYRRALRVDGCLALMMLDIDHFKNVNDQYGHDAGDVVLKQVASILKNVSRKDTIAGRIGGEEFLIVLPSVTTEEALHFAERMRQAVEERSISVGDKEISVTISVGVVECEMKTNDDSISMLMKHADEAMYVAKNTGRNKVVVYEGYREA